MSTRHTFTTDWDAPFERVSINFDFIHGCPATGPSYASGGEPGEPDSVEASQCVVTVDGKEYEAPGWLLDAFEKQFYDDMLEMGREERDEARAYRLGRAA